ncbi:MAG: CDP-alcohol phosphatidyltransferase family protein [Motilibacteraceae bacterium]
MAGGSAAVGDRVLTVPNALSLLRLVGVPVFLWLILAHHDGWALAVLMVSGATDYLDGKLARRWNQMTRLGQLLDPLADRLYILATLVGLTIRNILPLWLTVLIVGRDVLLAGTLPVLRRHGYGPLPVHFLGKAATFNLLYAFPLLLLGDGSGAIATVANVFGWAFAIWGTCLYWWAGVLYVVQVRQLAMAARGTSTGSAGGPVGSVGSEGSGAG